jgi:hypothetical protein
LEDLVPIDHISQIASFHVSRRNQVNIDIAAVQQRGRQGRGGGLILGSITGGIDQHAFFLARVGDELP